MKKASPTSKIGKRFIGPFLAKRKGNVFQLFDRYNRYYQTVHQQELKRVKISSEDLLVDLNSTEFIDDTLNATSSSQDPDPDYHLEQDNYILDTSNADELPTRNSRTENTSKSTKSKQDVTSDVGESPVNSSKQVFKYSSRGRKIIPKQK